MKVRSDLIEKIAEIRKLTGTIYKRVEIESGDISFSSIIVLLKIFKEKKDVTMSTISELTGFSNALITFSIDELEKKGIVERIRGLDRRNVFVRITPKGIDFANELSEKIQETFSKIFGNMSEEDYRDLLNSLEKSISIIKKYL